MKFSNFFKAFFVKYLRGMFALTAIWLVAGATVFVFDSCQRSNIEQRKLSSVAKQFNSSVNVFRNNFGSMKLSPANTSQDKP